MNQKRFYDWYGRRLKKLSAKRRLSRNRRRLAFHQYNLSVWPARGKLPTCPMLLDDPWAIDRPYSKDAWQVWLTEMFPIKNQPQPVVLGTNLFV